MITTEEKKTALYDEHIKLGAKMVPFGAWCMPVQYEGIIKEHNATREHAGLFDVSHMGEVYIKGKDSLAFLQHIVPQDLSSLNEGQAIYCQLPNKEGGLIDDLIIYNVKNIVENIDYLIRNDNTQKVYLTENTIDITPLLNETYPYIIDSINNG